MTVKKKLNVAFLGGGVNSAVGRAHYSAISIDGYFNLVAGCFSRHEELNHETAVAYGVDIDRVYVDLGTLIENEKSQLDAIIILTPTPNHVKEVSQCIEAGIPVICEKALGVNTVELGKLQATLNSRKSYLAVTFNYSGYPMLREIKKFLADNKIGKVEQIHIEMPQEGYSRLNAQGVPNRPQEWRLHDDKLPTISLDLGVHLHHIVSFLTNESPIELVASQQSFGKFSEVIDNILCIANYSNDLVVNAWYGKSALGYKNGLKVRVFGESGAIEWCQMNPEIMEFTDSYGRKSFIDRSDNFIEVACQKRYERFKAGHPAGYIEAFANYYLDVHEDLSRYLGDGETGHEYVFGFESSYAGIQMLEAISISTQEKRWVSI